jgi:hypothetical protein
MTDHVWVISLIYTTMNQSTLGVLIWATISPNPFLILLFCWIPTYYDVYSLVLDWTWRIVVRCICTSVMASAMVKGSSSRSRSLWRYRFGLNWFRSVDENLKTAIGTKMERHH